jgi:hypothetical protein
MSLLKAMRMHHAHARWWLIVSLNTQLRLFWHGQAQSGVIGRVAHTISGNETLSFEATPA